MCVGYQATSAMIPTSAVYHIVSSAQQLRCAREKEEK